MQRGGPIKHHAVRMPWGLFETMREHANRLGMSGNRLMVECIRLVLNDMNLMCIVEGRVRNESGRKGEVGKEDGNSGSSNQE